MVEAVERVIMEQQEQVGNTAAMAAILSEMALMEQILPMLPI